MNTSVFIVLQSMVMNMDLPQNEFPCLGYDRRPRWVSGEGGGVMSDSRGHSASTRDSRFGNARPSLHTSNHVETGLPVDDKG